MARHRDIKQNKGKGLLKNIFKKGNSARNDSLSDILLPSLTALFKKVMLVDLDADTYSLLDGSTLALDTGKCDGVYSILCEQTIRLSHSKDTKRMANLLGPDHLRQLFDDGESSFSFEYKVNETEWEKVSVIRADSKTGPPSRIIICTEDITSARSSDEVQKTALKEAVQNAEFSNKSKSTFLANMSHDIRTPMNAITGLTLIAKNHIGDSERVLACLDKIDLSSKQLLDLINDVLDLSKIEAGKITLQEAPFSVTELMEGIRLLADTQANAKNIGLDCTVNVNCTTFTGDRSRIRQIINNLVSNAVKYTPEGGSVSISVNESESDKDGYSVLTFAVKDNGIGMSESFMKKLFLPFQRAEDDARLGDIQGTGLGMAITKNLTDLMNGRIEVESKLDKGSIFTVTLTLKKAKEKTGSNDSAQEREQICDFTGKRVLLVEDNAINAEIATELLNMLQIESEHVWNGKEAVDRMAAAVDNYFDIILMDIEMPIMNGYEATKMIRTLPGLYPKVVPIVALTANAFLEDVQNAKIAGINEHLSKPIEMSQLTGILNKLL